MTWGADACVAVLSDYASFMKKGVLPLYGSEETETANLPANIICHESNDAGLPTFTGLANCELVQLANNFS